MTIIISQPDIFLLVIAIERGALSQNGHNFLIHRSHKINLKLTLIL